jgi:hypothetical protein
VLDDFVKRHTGDSPCIFARMKRTKKLIPGSIWYLLHKERINAVK